MPKVADVRIIDIMNNKPVNQDGQFDLLKWGFVVIGFMVALVANYYYINAVPLPLRLIGWIVVAGVLLGVAAFTTKGKQFVEFSKAARMELRKVTWPTRQETLQTTGLVILLVLVVGLLLWGIDSVLLWAVGWLTGQRG